MNSILAELATYIPIIILAIGIMAAIVSVVTEGLKFFEGLNKMPTQVLVIIVSMVITPATFIAIMAWYKQPIEWFMVFASFIAAFFIALVSMNGWDSITSIINRCIKKDK